MDFRLVTWFWFRSSEVAPAAGKLLNVLEGTALAKRLRDAADKIEKNTYRVVGDTVFDLMGSPIGYFEAAAEAKRFTK